MTRVHALVPRPVVSERWTAGFVVGCALFTSCADSTDNVAAPGADGLEVTPRSVTATTLGQTLQVTVTVGGQTSSASMSERSEQRWLDDRSVLDAQALAAARLVSSAPGRAVVSIAAAGQTDSVVVEVVPSQITVVEARLPGGRTHLGDGDTIVLRGYRMNQLTATNVSAPGVTATLVGADSASARLVVATVAVTGCVGAAPSFSIAFSGAVGAPVTGLSAKRSGELALAAGGARRLTDSAAACIRLPRTDSARYLVAYADTRVVVKAQTQPEWPLPESFIVSGADRSSAATGAPSPTLAEDAPPPLSSPADMRSLAPPIEGIPSACPFANSFLSFCRTSPYQVGEEFLYYPAGTQRPPGQSRVLAIRGNLVAAVFLPDSALLPRNAATLVDSALSLMVTRGLPLLQHAYDIAQPTRTSEESGQLLISLEQIANASGLAGWWPDPTNGHGRWARVALALDARFATGDFEAHLRNLVGLAAHEVLHTYQYRWRYEHASPWLTYVGGWGIEASTLFFVLEMERDRLGLGFLSNTPIGFYSVPLADLWGNAAAGSSLMRDLVQRLVEDGGLAYRDALREILPGVLEGWYGINEEGLARGLGLTARMRRRLGPSWNPVDALLDWTMSQAADDLTSNARYQNRTVQRLPGSTFALIEPHGTLENGASLPRLRPAGTTGVFRIADSRGGTYSLTATIRAAPTDALEWLVLRVR